MRTLALSLLIGLMWPAPVLAQVTDAERAAARELFREGDEMQRASKFAEALDKFQRAQQVFSAPTNMLRIAECETALGRLVESAESYRAVVRTPLPAGSPPAFQAAVDQARAELAQVEPRVPKLVVQVQPQGVTGAQMQIDGQSVPAALIGEPMSLDPGAHKVLVFAPGYASSEQQVALKERESKTATLALKPVAGVTYSSGSTRDVAAAPAAGLPPEGATAAPGDVPPPPPPIVEGPEAQAVRRRARTGLLFGGHLGAELPTGTVPLPITAGQASTDARDISAGGLAYALDGGLRFARQWYAGLTLEHAALGGGSDPSKLGSGVSKEASDTTLLGIALGLIVNPDKTSFYGEIGLAERWYTVTDQTNSQHYGYNSGEVLLGVGLWIPAGRSFSLLPKATVGLGNFDTPNAPSGTSTSSQGHAFFMLGVAGLFNVDL